jgi:hypothetical protein
MVPQLASESLKEKGKVLSKKSNITGRQVKNGLQPLGKMV